MRAPPQAGAKPDSNRRPLLTRASAGRNSRAKLQRSSGGESRAITTRSPRERGDLFRPTFSSSRRSELRPEGVEALGSNCSPRWPFGARADRSAVRSLLHAAWRKRKFRWKARKEPRDRSRRNQPTGQAPSHDEGDAGDDCREQQQGNTSRRSKSRFSDDARDHRKRRTALPRCLPCRAQIGDTCALLSEHLAANSYLYKRLRSD